MDIRPKNSGVRRPLIGLCAVAIMFGLSTGSVLAADKAAISPSETKHGSLDRIGKKLANPVSDIWAITTSWNMPTFYDGDVNTGDPKVGASMVIEPILPFPLFGSGKDEWRLVSRPVIPLVLSAPVPTGVNKFDHKTGIGDIQLPTLVNLPERSSGKWLLGAGQVSLLPTATSDDLGSSQWAMGPAVVLGYKTENAVGGIFPNYFWKIGSAGQDADTPDINQGSLLYFFNYSLPNGWEVGTNPTITYNHNAESENKWNVPVGGYVGKMIRLGRLPVNIKVGAEYSVVSENDFGKRHSFRFLITPVIPGLVKKPIFGN